MGEQLQRTPRLACAWHWDSTHDAHGLPARRVRGADSPEVEALMALYGGLEESCERRMGGGGAERGSLWGKEVETTLGSSKRWLQVASSLRCRR